MAYNKPQTIIHQRFATVPNMTEDELRAVIVGPSAILHRYADSDEKTDTYIGIYNPTEDVVFEEYPHRQPGGIVDNSYSKLFVDNALLVYFDSDKHEDVFTNDEDYANVITSSTFFFVDSDKNAHSAVLGVRDVQVGDYVEVTVTGRDENDDCTTLGTMLSRIVGFTEVYSQTAIETPTIVGPNDSSEDDTFKVIVNNVPDDAATTSDSREKAKKLKEGVTNEGVYDFLKWGIVRTVKTPTSVYNELYAKVTVTVMSYTKTHNCDDVVKVRIRCPQTNEDDIVEIKKDVALELTTKYGVADNNPRITISDSVIDANDPNEPEKTYWDYFIDLIKDGENSVSFEWVQQPNYTKIYNSPEITVDGVTTPAHTDIEVLEDAEYTGEIDDLYVLNCTEGGTIAAETGPKFDLYTAYGQDTVTGITFTSAAKDTTGIKIGTRGIVLKVASGVTSICGGTIIQIKVQGRNVVGINGIALADDLMNDMLYKEGAAPHLSIKLMAKKNIEVPAKNSFTDINNWEQEPTQFTVNEAITIANTEFIREDGTYIPLALYGYGDKSQTKYTDFSKMYFEYREWSPVHASSCSFCDTVGNLDDIIGPLDPDNPLKWAVYKALTNSGGASVAYVAVKNPDDLDDWQDALDILEGREDVYTIVPLTKDLTVQNLVLTLVNKESAAEACRWKTALFNLDVPVVKKTVGYSANNVTEPTSIDGKATFGKFIDNPEESGDQYTKFVCTSGNSGFIDFGVEPGDVLKVFSGNNKVAGTYVVDQVYSNTTLITMTGPNAMMEEVKFEIWHNVTRNEEVEYIRDRAQSLASRRIGLVWPDTVSENGVEMPGYFLCAALAGLKSGVKPQEGLTRRTIQGFDNFSRSKPHFTETQLDLMASSGVWICVEDADGTPQSRHALTTSTISAFYSEEMMTRNFDSVSKQLYRAVDLFIGTSNVNQDTLLDIANSLRDTCSNLISSGQMISYDNITVRQHDLLLDRVVAYLSVGLPFAVNNIEIFVTAGAYNLNEIVYESEA